MMMTRLSLAQLQADHGSVLILDAAGCSQAALVEPGALRAVQRTGSAGVALFEAIAAVGGAGAIDRAAAFVFCQTPGSVLGARTCAMAIRVWTTLRERPAYAYHGLELLAAAHGRSDTAFIADARRGEWHYCRAGQPSERVLEAELAARAEADAVSLATPRHFRAWSTPPAGLREADYELDALWQHAASAPLLTPCPEPDALLAAEPAYVRWTPQLHGEGRA
jgi:tRNA threonylcarbamoyladenosine biosynthesis protein TsaB